MFAGSCQSCLFPFSESFLETFLTNEADPSITDLQNNSEIDSNLTDEINPIDDIRAQLSSETEKFRTARGLKIGHLNVGNGGLLHHLDELTSLCDLFKPDVLAVSETWLNQNTPTDCANIIGYDFLRRDKPKDLIGAQGVGLYIKHGISYTQRSDLELDGLMCTGVQINLQNRKPLNIVVLYRHPHSPVSFYKLAEELFTMLDSKSSTSIITGDFNINYNILHERNSPARKLDDIAAAHGFKQTIKLPTRITETTTTCIDLTFTNAPNFTAGVAIVSVADHLLNYINIGRRPTQSNHRYIMSRNFRKLDTDKLLEDLKQIPWNVTECFNSVNDAWHAWKCLYTDVINTHAPLRKFRAPKSAKIPWYDEKIDKMKKLRDQFHRRATIGNLAIDWLRYRQTRNKVTELVRKAKKEYYSSMIENNRGDSKSTWKILKDLLPKRSDGGITSLEENGSIITDFKEICNVFNNYFIDISTKLAASIKNVKTLPLEYLGNFLPNVTTVFKFKNVTENEVLKMLKSIPNGKATGVDNLQVRILKISAPAIAKSLAYIINLSLSSGEFPKDWKSARISPIFKKGSKTEPGNYRPVSVLPVVSKFIERVVHQQLYHYLDKNKLLCTHQSGFRKKHSCQTSLHRLNEKLYSELESGKMVGLVALDLKKAFDTVNHSVLLDKMSYYGVQDKELKWFQTYLTDRLQLCTMFNNRSEAQQIKCGVPQGSILGPLMFILYVNDMPTCFTKCDVNIYADDTAFYYAANDLSTIKNVLKSELKSVFEWLCANKLSLHIGKTNSLLICSQQKRRHLTNTNLSLDLDGDDIEQVSSLKYLGVIIDENLKYKEYMDALIGKLNRSIGIVRRASRYVDQITRVTLYNTLVLPHIDYCSTVWGKSICKKDLSRLQRIQNSAMRIILECHYRTHICDMLKTLKWLSVEQRLDYNICCQMWKIVNKQAPSYLNHINVQTSTVHNYNTRAASQNNIHVAHSHKNSLKANGTEAWNSLPPHIKNCDNFRHFKNLLLKHIRMDS